MKFYLVERGEETGRAVELPCKPSIGEFIYDDGICYLIDRIIYDNEKKIWLVCGRHKLTPKLKVDSDGHIKEMGK